MLCLKIQEISITLYYTWWHKIKGVGIRPVTEEDPNQSWCHGLLDRKMKMNWHKDFSSYYRPSDMKKECYRQAIQKKAVYEVNWYHERFWNANIEPTPRSPQQRAVINKSSDTPPPGIWFYSHLIIIGHIFTTTCLRILFMFIYIPQPRNPSIYIT